MIKYDIKEQKELIQVYEEWEEELLRERELQENCLDYTRSFWQGEAAETMRGEMHAFFESGKFSRYLEQIKGIREVMEEAVPEMETLRQMCSDFPEALGKAGVKCESKSYIFVDLQELTKLNANMDDYINKMQETQNGLYRIMDMGRGVVDFGNLYEDVDEISIRIEQMRNLKAAINEYACRMQRLDAYLEMAYSRWVLEEQEEGTVQGENDSSEYTENQAVEREYALCGLSDFFYRGESCTTEELREIVDAAYGNMEISQKEQQQLMYWITMLEHVPASEHPEITAAMRSFYEAIIERNRLLEEDFLRDLGFEIEILEENPAIEDFAVELRSALLRYEITDEQSIRMFLATCMAETSGYDLVEVGDADRGAGLIQVTGVSQDDFLEYVQSTFDITEDERAYIEILQSGYDYDESDNSYEGYSMNSIPGEMMTPKEYIATNYPIESAVWFWADYRICATYDNPQEHGNSVASNYCTINDYISFFGEECMEREEDLYLVVQYYVNAASYRAWYLQEMLSGWCEADGVSYVPTYEWISQAEGNNTVIGTDEILEEIRNQAREGNPDDLPEITQVLFHGLEKNAPNRMSSRLYYYYLALILQEEMG